MLKRLLVRRGDDSGFTVIELVVASALLVIVLAVMGSTLISLTNTASRGEALVANEQAESFALTQLARDIRGAASMVPLASTSAYSSEIEVVEVNPDGGTGPTIAWVFDPGTRSLTREILSGGVVSSRKVELRPVLNTGADPVFRLFASDGTDMVVAGSTPATIAACTTRVHISVESSVDPGPQPFVESEDVQLRNQLANLQAQQGNPC